MIEYSKTSIYTGTLYKFRANMYKRIGCPNKKTQIPSIARKRQETSPNDKSMLIQEDDNRNSYIQKANLPAYIH